VLINAVVKYAPVKGGEYLLLLILAKYAADDGTRVFPSVDTMAKDTRQNRRAVQKQLRSLESKGLLVRVGETIHGTHNYRIAIEKLSTGDEGRGERQPPQGADQSHPGNERESQRGVPAPPDSLDSSLISQKRADKPEVKTNFKTEAGCDAIAHIWTFLKKPPARAKP
jgi:hypothetical protein